MKILVTGGAGFIGSHVVDAYVAAGHTVAVLDDFSTGKREHVSPEVRLYEGSIEDADVVRHAINEFQPEIINHHAAQISVVVSVQQVAVDASRNILGTINILESARQSPSVKKIIYASSGGAMYGNAEVVPTPETAPSNAEAPYGLSKFVAEQYVWLYTKMAHFTATVLRYSNVYGPRQDPHGEAGVCAIFAQRMIDGDEVTIFGDGNQLRDYIYVGDIVKANMLVLDKGDGEAFNVCTGVGTSTNEVYQILKAVTGYEKEAVRAPERAGEAKRAILDPAKIERQLGWRPTVDFATGSKETIAWYRSK